MKSTPIVVSYSEIDAMRQCGHKHDLAFRLGWTSRTTAPALSKGKLYHDVMEIHYKAIMVGAPESERLRAIAETLLDAEERNAEEAQLVAWMYDGHLEKWGTDDQWEILAVEDQSLMRLPDRNGRASRFYLRMRIDLLVSESVGGRPKIYVVDHKTGQNLPHEKELDLDDQFGLYTWGLRKKQVPVFGAIYSAARTQRNVGEMDIDDRFRRYKVWRTDQELETIAREAWETSRTAYARPVWQAPRSPDSHPIGPSRCKAKCPFTEPCLVGRKSGRFQELTFLRSGGFEELDEETRLAQRGYIDPLMPK